MDGIINEWIKRRTEQNRKKEGKNKKKTHNTTRANYAHKQNAARTRPAQWMNDRGANLHLCRTPFCFGPWLQCDDNLVVASGVNTKNIIKIYKYKLWCQNFSVRTAHIRHMHVSRGKLKPVRVFWSGQHDLMNETRAKHNAGRGWDGMNEKMNRVAWGGLGWNGVGTTEDLRHGHPNYVWGQWQIVSSYRKNSSILNRALGSTNGKSHPYVPTRNE